MAIRLIIDSASDISGQKADEMGITLIPMPVSFGNEQFLTGVNITPHEFYEKLIESDCIPVTSQITPYSYGEAIRSATENGDTAIVITVSSKLSGTYQSAALAAKDYEGSAFVVDSLNASLGEAILIYYAARLIKEGKSAVEIVAELNRARHKIKVMALLDTLEYLKKGGRISAAAAAIGGLLSIKPVIAIEDGEVHLVGKARGSKQGNNLLTELVDKCGGINFNMPYTLAYSGLSDMTLKKYIKDSEKIWQGHTEELPVLEIGATIGTHAGPGAVAVAFFSL